MEGRDWHNLASGRLEYFADRRAEEHDKRATWNTIQHREGKPGWQSPESGLVHQ